jgi:hypothetical protein
MPDNRGVTILMILPYNYNGYIRLYLCPHCWAGLVVTCVHTAGQGWLYLCPHCWAGLVVTCVHTAGQGWLYLCPHCWAGLAMPVSTLLGRVGCTCVHTAGQGWLYLCPHCWAGLAITCVHTADRQSTPGGRHLFWLASPSRRQE